jgi:predicted  nucleic acid-binding Zn-ribbon protein
MSQNQYTAFLSLAQIDTSIRDYEKQYESCISSAEKITSYISDLEQTKEKAQQKLDDLVRVKLREEQKLDDLSFKLEKLLDQKHYVRTQKELMLIEKEIASLIEEQEKQDEELLQIWNTHDAFQSEYQKLLVDFDEHMNTFTQEYEEYHACAQHVRNNIEELREKRESMIPYIDQELLQSYNQMQKSVDNPVVPVDKNTCTGCHCLISSQDILHLESHKLLTCNECFRFLYIS